MDPWGVVLQSGWANHLVVFICCLRCSKFDKICINASTICWWGLKWEHQGGVLINEVSWLALISNLTINCHPGASQTGCFIKECAKALSWLSCCLSRAFAPVLTFYFVKISCMTLMISWCLLEELTIVHWHSDYCHERQWQTTQCMPCRETASAAPMLWKEWWTLDWMIDLLACFLFDKLLCHIKSTHICACLVFYRFVQLMYNGNRVFVNLAGWFHGEVPGMPNTL